MSRVVRWIQRRFGRGRPTDQPTLNLPNDWVSIHIWFDHRDLSRKQRRAVRSLDGWRPVVKVESRKPGEESPLEKRMERLVDGVKQEEQTTIQIHREDIPPPAEKNGKYGKEYRNIRAQKSINKLLTVFPDEQIEIRRHRRNR